MGNLLPAQYDPRARLRWPSRATIERTEKRFANYAKSGLLCGNDGLPHLIADPGLALRYGHAGEVLVSALYSLSCLQRKILRL